MPKTYDPSTDFIQRHIGPSAQEKEQMLKKLGISSLGALMQKVVPEGLIGGSEAAGIGGSLSELDAAEMILGLLSQNRINNCYLGQGYYPTTTPAVIQRNVLENPGWYTQYTPYQSEISQGRLEALFLFQTIVSSLTGLPIANASMLDEATAAAEAIFMLHRSKGLKDKAKVLIAEDCHPQNIDVIQGRCSLIGIEVEEVSLEEMIESVPEEHVFAIVVQYPSTFGTLEDYTQLLSACKTNNVGSICCGDLLALTLLESPGKLGFDVCVGSSQRFGMPMGYGGPHAGFYATTEQFKRQLPGRIVGVSQDRLGQPGFRLALQTREQHIRRDKATSNICTAQALPAIVSTMYAVYHGPQRLQDIADQVHQHAQTLADNLKLNGFKLLSDKFFCTVSVYTESASLIVQQAYEHGYLLRLSGDNLITIACHEQTTSKDIENILSFFGIEQIRSQVHERAFPSRQSAILQEDVFQLHQSETGMLRFLKKLENKDLSLTLSMIPLGSCTMKLNGTTEMLPLSWPELAQLHPFCPKEDARGILTMMNELEQLLANITGFAATSLQPNAGSQGEYAGLAVIRAFHNSQGEGHRNKVLIPTSAHGTNPASAVLAGLEVVPVKCDHEGSIDLEDLTLKISKHKDLIAGIMLTYPSTHGVFETTLGTVCHMVHQVGGQVYLDGANMNAMAGWCYPGTIGADVCHLNLHKTFCIPHGGGGPGVGPICVAEHLAPFLPRTDQKDTLQGIDPVSGSPFGSPLILPITYLYLKLIGDKGLAEATATAILNANYISQSLKDVFNTVYTGADGLVAHECILDCREFKESAHISVEDIAKRLIDYGFHSPTMSWPVAGTLMVEPTESENLAELNRFIEAMTHIRKEIELIENGTWDSENNPLKNAPHTSLELAGDWPHPYSRKQAAYPYSHSEEYKFWPSVTRVNNAAGDRNLLCTCSAYFEQLKEQE